MTDQSNTQNAMFFEKIADKVKCNICSNQCLLSNGSLSRCISRRNINGQMVLCTYAYASSIAVDPIEKKPLYHFFPGSLVFSIGGWGCNFNCLHCQNSGISQPNKNQELKSYFLPPEEAIRNTINSNSHGICWTYNEPSIWYEYTYHSAIKAKEKGLYTAYVTNGFLQKEPLRTIAPFLDAYRVDFKGFSDELYQKLCGVKEWKNIYSNAVLAKELDIHVEVVTNIVPEFNDSEATLRSIAKFISENLGKETPWHLTRFFPHHKVSNKPPTSNESLDLAYEIAISEGLKFAYKGNLGTRTETICPNCKNIAIDRSHKVTTKIDLNGNCSVCGQYLNICLRKK